jgi:hypothetical protein
VLAASGLCAAPESNQIRHDHPFAVPIGRKLAISCLAHWFVQDSNTMAADGRQLHVARGGDDMDAQHMQQLDEAIGTLATSEIEVDERGVGWLLGS